MRQKIAKTQTKKSEALGEVSQAPICFDLLRKAPNFQGISEQASKPQIGAISTEKPKTEGSISEESANSPEFKAEFSGETSQALDSSVYQPKAPKLEAFTKKAQISTIPGISPRERHRYRVTFGSEVLGERLTVDEALKLAKGGKN